MSKGDKVYLATLDEDKKLKEEQFPVGLQSKRTVRFVIGTSTAGWTQKDCDYLCDGTEDQIEINQAIQDLPVTGGEIRILDGIYNITGNILLNRSGTNISGNGKNTILKRMWSEVNMGVILLSGCADNILSNFTIDGNKSTYKGDGIWSKNYYIYNLTIENVFIKNCSNMGCKVLFAKKTKMTNNHVENCDSWGLVLSSSNDGVISGNICVENKIIGIYCDSNKINIIGNVCRDSEKGIFMSQSKICTVMGNIIMRGEGASSDYTSLHETIYANNATNCVIVGNNCSGKAPTVSGTGNIMANNKY